ncbi:hypothetical protein PSTG_15969 [Puccinia striiformis f. sp. tritici PST-78]|uniref:Uncharacterized protein n=1 Tax=Puccinia striiformis f. sp. tritici PST-78 TaxID=1165861 RepID=A0A0L0UU82_9BASI|nr:hypothetical protein PSTG_15969 [Puccinia striiformis f. sp. tritici PST-78]
MMGFFRVIALVLLMAPWEVTGNDDRVTYFGCWEKVDALCALATPDGSHQTLTWAERLHPRKRDYACYGDNLPLCCERHKFQAISTAPSKSIFVKTEDIKHCAHGGQ